MVVSPSFWEIQSWLKNIDICIIGAGIVGLNAAIYTKELNPQARVVVLERGYFPMGGSTRNAGFACFGSMTELMDDIEKRSLNEVMTTVKRRWDGLKLLRKLLGDERIAYEPIGGYEVFTKGDEAIFDKAADFMAQINGLMEEYLGEKEVFSLKSEMSQGLGLREVPKLIFNKLEGQLDPGKMIKALIRKAQDHDIEIWNGVNVNSVSIERNVSVISTENFEFEVSNLILATNAFATQLVPDLEISAVRNQVIITDPILGLRLRGCFHYHKGYGYFRNVGNRVLVGGWRHLDQAGEQTSEFGESGIIQRELERWLSIHIIPGESYKIATRWSGILGVGRSKNPIIKRLGNHAVLAARLGGMGVAIGSAVGREAVKELFQINE